MDKKAHKELLQNHIIQATKLCISKKHKIVPFTKHATPNGLIADSYCSKCSIGVGVSTVPNATIIYGRAHLLHCGSDETVSFPTNPKKNPK